MEASDGIKSPASLEKAALEPLLDLRYHSEHLLEAQELNHVQFTLSPFRKLPAEVREMIYIAAMKIEPANWRKMPGWVNRSQSTSSALRATLPSAHGRYPKPRLALLFTCRQIYQEAWHLYYGNELFSFRKARPLLSLLTEAGWTRRPELQIVEVHLGCSRYYETLYHESRAVWEALVFRLSQCEHLRKLNIFVYEGWLEGSHLRRDFTLPLRELTNVDVSVTSYERWGWNASGERRAHLKRRWRLVQGNHCADLQLEEEDGRTEEEYLWEDVY